MRKPKTIFYVGQWVRPNVVFEGRHFTSDAIIGSVVADTYYCEDIFKNRFPAKAAELTHLCPPKF